MAFTAMGKNGDSGSVAMRPKRLRRTSARPGHHWGRDGASDPQQTV